jgi:hypothetical protein
VSSGTLRNHSLRASFRSSPPKAGAYFITRFWPPGWPGGYFVCVITAGSHASMSQESCDRPLFPHAASQLNLYLDSAPSGASQIQSIYYDYCTHTKFYSYEPGLRFNYFIVITLPRIQIATASTVAIDSHHVALSPQRFLIAHCTS